MYLVLLVLARRYKFELLVLFALCCKDFSWHNFGPNICNVELESNESYFSSIRIEIVIHQLKYVECAIVNNAGIK